jgi:hypothetical protein
VLPDRYQVVVLDCAYDTWGNPQTRELLLRTLSLKLNGYLSAYPYGTLPIDTTDFICAHLLICERRSHELFPVMGYKCTSLDRSKTHRLAFPCQAILQASGADAHLKQAEQIVGEAVSAGRRISYDGSWTLDPVIRADEILAPRFKDALIALNVLHHLDSDIPEILGFGMPRFKTDQFFRFIGYEPVSGGDGPLPELKMSTLQNEPAVLMHLRKFTDLALAVAKRFEPLWRNRIEISDPGAIESLGFRKAA